MKILLGQTVIFNPKGIDTQRMAADGDVETAELLEQHTGSQGTIVELMDEDSFYIKFPNDENEYLILLEDVCPVN